MLFLSNLLLTECIAQEHHPKRRGIDFYLSWTQKYIDENALAPDKFMVSAIFITDHPFSKINRYFWGQSSKDIADEKNGDNPWLMIRFDSLINTEQSFVVIVDDLKTSMNYRKIILSQSSQVDEKFIAIAKKQESPLSTIKHIWNMAQPQLDYKKNFLLAQSYLSGIILIYDYRMYYPQRFYKKKLSPFFENGTPRWCIQFSYWNNFEYQSSDSGGDGGICMLYDAYNENFIGCFR